MRQMFWAKAALCLAAAFTFAAAAAPGADGTPPRADAAPRRSPPPIPRGRPSAPPPEYLAVPSEESAENADILRASPASAPPAAPAAERQARQTGPSRRRTPPPPPLAAADPYAAASGGPPPAEPPPLPPPEANPVHAVILDLNAANLAYPGLAAAKAQGNLRAAGGVIWRILRDRRVIQAVERLGPRGSFSLPPSPHEYQRLAETVNYSGPEGIDPALALAAADRVDHLLDTFDQALLDDPSYGAGMEAILVRLHSDIVAIADAMAQADASIVPRLAATHGRAAALCDFFIFPRAPAGNIHAASASRPGIAVNADGFFYPDGSSRGGDVAGVSGGLFRSLLASVRHGRGVPPATARSLEQPVRHLLGLALPDGTPPLFGPRGQGELGSGDLAALAALYPKAARAANRAGLSASNGYPDRSDAISYGGIYATRSGPEADARYLAARFGPPSQLPGAPTHLDFGSLVIASRNARYVDDAGGFDGYPAGAPAHSVLSLDGGFVTEESYPEPEMPVRTIWRTNASLDYVSGAAAFADGKVWQRTILYVKDLPGETKTDYWLVLDHIDVKADPRPHQVDIRYRLVPGIQVYHENPGIIATPDYGGPNLRFYAADENAQLHSTGDGLVLSRQITGDTTTSTLIYPGDGPGHRPARIERDKDIIRGRTGVIVVDHGADRVDVIAWAPPGQELISPTLSLQMSADLGVFRLRRGKIARVNFVNLERYQAMDPNGGLWSMRVDGPPQTLTLEPEAGGGWQVLSDPINIAATLYDAGFGSAAGKRTFFIRPEEMKVIPR